MTALFSSPKTPAPVQIPAAPTPADPAVQQAAQASATAAAQAAGQGSTLLTGGQGATDPLNVQKQVLLGG